MSEPSDIDRSKQSSDEEIHEGVVIRSTGSWYEVRIGDRTIPSKMRGRFRLGDRDETNPVAVGDRVTIRMNEDKTGMITEIADRTNKLSRRAAGKRIGLEHVIVANIDMVWTIQSFMLPKPNPGFIDRVLVMAEAHEIQAGIVFNKLDLLQKNESFIARELPDLYAELGYQVLLTSAKTHQGLEALKEALSNKTSVVTGPSGVGKSMLLNAIEPSLDIDTRSVSQKTRKGRHATTYVSLYPLSIGGYVVDTPGIREFGVLEIEPWELSHYFVEFKLYFNNCRFPTCTHDHEPDCGIKQALSDGLITEQRYFSYLNILFSLRLGEKDVGR